MEKAQRLECLGPQPPSHLHTHVPAQPLQITKTNLKTKGKQRKPSPITSTNFSPGLPLDQRGIKAKVQILNLRCTLESWKH